MKIVADENIVALEEFFGAYGEVLRLPGRAISAEHLRDADALLVRSVTRVDAALLANSPLRFVGTATAGLDHIDLAFLKARGIAFQDAAGANANSVVEYLFCALAALAGTHGLQWRELSFGIIGAGHIGGRLAVRLRALGIRHVVNDPLLPPERFADCRVDLDTALAQDVVTFHTPLTRDGPHPTVHLLDRSRLALLRPQQVLINAARGAVVDNAALRERLTAGKGPLCVLDAWEGEPAIDLDLLERVDLGSAHIAGYSLDGKREGTRRVRDGLQACFGLPPEGDGDSANEAEILALPADDQGQGNVDAFVNRCLLAAYDIREDHRRLLAARSATDPAAHFDALRKHYPRRLEFSHFRVRAPGEAGELLRVLGFRADTLERPRYGKR